MVLENSSLLKFGYTMLHAGPFRLLPCQNIIEAKFTPNVILIFWATLSHIPERLFSAASNNSESFRGGPFEKFREKERVSKKKFSSLFRS